MSAPEADVMKQPATPTGHMIRTLMGIAMLSGFLVVLAYQVTKPIIAENQRRAIEAAVFKVIPDAVTRRDFVLNDQGLVAVDPQHPAEGMPIYAGYDAEGHLKGIAAPAASQGYADTIQLLYGYDPDCSCIRGIKVLKLAETPGLGDKILSDPGFLANFKALDASPSADGKTLANAIVTVKHGTKQHPWQIDAISGATISSKAVGRALNESAQAVVPRVAAQLEKLRM